MNRRDGRILKERGDGRSDSIKRKLSIPSGSGLFDMSFLILMTIALTAPNIIFSGASWFQTLHLMKWTVALVPVAIGTIIVGLRLLKGKRELTSFRIDPFGWIWLALFLYLTLQPLWMKDVLKSPSTFYREWFFFASLWAVYVLCYNFFQEKRLRILLWFASLNGALNVIFAELQMAGLNGPFPFILPTPGNYIGNTGQQNMLGLWLAMTALGSIFLFLKFGVSSSERRNPLNRLFTYSNIIFLVIISWGLWNSTSRSAILSLLVGIIVLSVLLLLRSDRRALKRLGVIFFIFIVAFTASSIFNSARVGSLVSKTEDLIQNSSTVGGRSGIWRTSWTMFKMHPLGGVGLGQFKWNYLDAQREVYRTRPDHKWQYTNWAHNEILQWFCETGAIAGIVLLLMGCWWLWRFGRLLLVRYRGDIVLSSGTIWACSMLFLIWFNALWTRPFHRIEDALWLPLAFAIANRTVLPADFGWSRLRKPLIYRMVALLMIIYASAGIYFLGSGMIGDRQIRQGTLSRTPLIQRSWFERARDHVMVRDLADRQLAYHYIAVGKASKNTEYLAEGLNRLLASFNSEPRAKELNTLLRWSSVLKRSDLMKSLAGYLKPGRYRLTSGN